MLEFDNFIGGRRIPSSGTDKIEVRSPYDGSLVGRVPNATTEDVDLAVATARKAFDDGPWPRFAPDERCAVLRRFAELHAAGAEAFANLVVRENGMPLWFARAVQDGIAPQNDAYLAATASYPWEAAVPGFAGNQAIWRREPVGVVAAIIPWNAPHQSALVKLFPALLAGCTVILKVAPETAIDGHILGELFKEAGLPEGVLSILAADRDVSERLVVHPGIDKIAFTGSSAAGKRIASLAGGQLKRFSLELGGKSAAIILPDADLDATVAGLRYASFPNSGQVCVAQTRILISEGQHDAFVERLSASIAALKIGDPLDPDTFFGPLVAERQRARVEDYIALGIREGATLSLGGTGRPPGIDQGCFVRPTIFSRVANEMRIAQEEIFGPVVCVIPYGEVTDSIRIANASDYGLSGSVWTSDPARGLEIARQVRTGTFSINGAPPSFIAPFGGFKQSGMGREFGVEGLGAYVEHKAIAT